jgi:glycerophosphoryl diester phosphodiesterase
VDFLSVDLGLVDQTTARRAHNAGKQVHVWSVNDPVEMSRLIDLGVDNIITDDPLVAREVLQARAELSDVERLILYIRSRLGSR